MANKIMKTLTIGENTYEIVDENARNGVSALENSAVLYTTQSLIDEQKAQARENIGAVGDAEVGMLEKTVYGGNIDAAHTNFVKTSVNLFDSRRVQIDRLIETSGKYADKSIYTCSHPIPVKKGIKYRFIDETNYCFAYCDADGNILESGSTTRETIDDVQYMVFTADRDGFVVVNSNKIYYKTFMFCEHDKYPSQYVPYLLTISEREVEYQADSKKLLHDMGVYDVQNKFDKTAVTTGVMLDGGKLKTHSLNTVSDYIEVVRGVKYAFMFNSQTYGSGFAGAVEAYDSNKQYIGYKEADGIVWHVKPTEYSLESIGVISCENPNIKYIRITNYKGVLDKVMVVEGDTYPEEYREYGYTFNNMFRMNDTQKAEIAKYGAISPLFGKVAVFDGDSFGSGSSAKDGLNGWAGRIGASNSMVWKNYAVGGGTIKQAEGKHFIGNMDAIYAEYPTLDYLILEGGTNDATSFGEDGLGTFNATDYGGNYDTNTFSGAFETMLYKAITYYPTAKIGYIVAHNIKDSIYRTFFDRAIELCKKWGIPYIDLWHCSHLNKLLTAHYDSSLGEQGNIDAGKLYTDGKHLTPTGYEVITPKIEAWMKIL